jgi:hypothetical protein
LRFAADHGDRYITRNDLRDEFAMADEAFALSPISARAALPSEADYDAIREAFMETSRGRWFLTEYAKRNRNADTTMVLDAVARIEQTLAAQKEATTDDGLAKALAAIRNSLEGARAIAAKAFADPAQDDAIAPIQKGVRIIREISWRWREIGGDGRICDLLDSQATVIEGASMQLAAKDDVSALEAAFGLIETTLDDLSDIPAAMADTSSAETAPPSATTISEEKPPPSAAVAPEQPVAAAEMVESQADTAAIPDTRIGVHQEMATPDRDKDTSATAIDDDDMAHDDAVLDMIALEMGAPDFDESEMDDAGAPAPVSAEPEAASEPRIVAESADASIAPEAGVEAQSSLGASLLASGIITRTPPRSDPLAPIRRMTQAEKIAFFS